MSHSTFLACIQGIQGIQRVYKVYHSIQGLWKRKSGIFQYTETDSGHIQGISGIRGIRKAYLVYDSIQDISEKQTHLSGLYTGITKV